ncbi:MAG: peptidoglycan endopeptidase [Sphingomonas fennica]
MGEERRAAIVAAARACIGARFRPYGRDPAWGLDCVGLAACAFGRAVPRDYPLRGGDAGCVARAAAAAGLVAAPRPAPGDLLLIDCGSRQLHLAVLTETGFVHADAGIGRVVEAPGRPAGRIVAAYREGE